MVNRSDRYQRNIDTAPERARKWDDHVVQNCDKVTDCYLPFGKSPRVSVIGKYQVLLEELLTHIEDLRSANRQLLRGGGTAFAVTLDGTDHAWGPFLTEADAQEFADFVTAEIDPARVTPVMPGAALRDPTAELLAWRKASAEWTNPA